ncbi:AAA family ATPase [Enterobacter mori]|uniref:ATP-binding protein n=1 Tax=Enterobacter mori TaxID=539813 RepID=UPI000E74451E|nr:ATP-binding protein [Enterobacter mori]KAA1061536.1 ATP-binding protein [Enterobacter mori]
MIFTRLKFNNLCAFSDAEINLSYPRQLANSPLDNEFLHGRPKFYYRKVCVITGANASGKTSLGRMIWGLQSFLFSKNLHSSAFPINDKNKCASFEVDFASDDFTHHRIYVRFKSDPTGSHIINEIKYASVYIGENDSCVKTTKQLDLEFASHERKKAIDYFYGVAAEGYSVNLEEFKKIRFRSGWYYLLSETKETNDEISDIDKNILELVIKTFDPSIKSVSELREIQEVDGVKEEILSGFSIRFQNNDNVIVTKSGDVANYTRLSRGTYDSVKLSLFISAIQADYLEMEEHENTVCMAYFLDERMAYVHSELERAIITLIISKLPINSQFFYTTHNSDIFKLDLPIHSFIFLKKEHDNTIFVDACKILKKNDRNLSKYVENDVFGVLPDLSLIEELI